MLYKKILLVFLLLIKSRVSYTNHSINVEGNIELVDINEPIVLNIKYNEETNVYGFAFLKIYQDFELIYDKTIYVPDAGIMQYQLNSLSTYNTLSLIKVETNYFNNEDYENTAFTIKYYSPSNKTRMANLNVTYTSKNPVNYKFIGSGTNVSIKKEYETFNLSGNAILKTTGRYVDFSSYYYRINPLFTMYNQNQAIIELDYIFENLNEEEGKTILYITTIKEDNIYHLNNPFEYYISKETGNISMYYDDSYYETLMPLFIPLSYGYDFYIDGVITIEDVNKNHETFYSRFKIKVGSKLIDEKFQNQSLSKFDYVITTIIENVEYES